VDHSRISALLSRDTLEIRCLNFCDFGISKPGNRIPSEGSTRNLGESLPSFDSCIRSRRHTAARRWRVLIKVNQAEMVIAVASKIFFIRLVNVHYIFAAFASGLQALGNLYH
jgi:hypothetical protein